jgi:hypothetical protein
MPKARGRGAPSASFMRVAAVGQLAERGRQSGRSVASDGQPHLGLEHVRRHRFCSLEAGLTRRRGRVLRAGGGTLTTSASRRLA